MPLGQSSGPNVGFVQRALCGEKKYPVVLKNDPNRIENEEKRWKYMQQFRVINKIRGSISFHLVSQFRFGMGDPGKDDRKIYWGVLEE